MKNINIHKDDIHDMIWMSIRYCIGRHTIAATTHAYTIANIIWRNPNLLTKDEKDRLVVDIRREINNVCKWNPWFSVHNITRTDDEIFTPILIKSNDVLAKNEVIFVYDADNEEGVTFKPIDEKQKHNFSIGKFDKDYHDLLPWIKLANWLDADKHVLVTCEYDVDGVKTTTTTECYSYPAYFQGEYGIVYDNITKASDMRIQRYIIPEYITKIEPINNGENK